MDVGSHHPSPPLTRYQLAELLIVAESELKVARDDVNLLDVTGNHGVALLAGRAQNKLEHLGGEVLEAPRQQPGRRDFAPLRGATFAPPPPHFT